MKIVFSEQGWEDYLYWQEHDRKLLERINALIRECTRAPFAGIGKPEPLRGPLSGWWSRRITQEHRLVYRAEGDQLMIAQCRYHY
ncbi:Txe/YoeB family addiction module toxin [Mesorhizobium sp. CGMCC 1.15528]|uniref:Putative mRNA interferase YoeB n=1 Tax=Mesorhizobium zhangyense TaxID=1776730 RepID=A0A7C9V5G6_9HYPH|nr:Txe/YoeB family addiction module toxin [Mesorhizobium zhangyense]NGN41245.1 Txe/YoeB family addiction module toxin [Mesorhizobium zhangyense]